MNSDVTTQTEKARESIRTTTIIAGWDDETAKLLAAAGMPSPVVVAMFLKALNVVN
jgi:hypothetical protein